MANDKYPPKQTKRKVNMAAIMPWSSKTIRTGFWTWWNNHGCPFTHFCGIYNTGSKLFLEHSLPPGSFFEPPTILRHFPYVAGFDDRSGIILVHRGHENPYDSNSLANITAIYGPTRLNLVVSASHMVYVMREGQGLVAAGGCMPLPRSLLAC